MPHLKSIFAYLYILSVQRFIWGFYMPFTNNIRIGTCSWKYDSWVGLLYSDLDKSRYLEQYSKHYNTVEVDQWFWSAFEGKDPVLPKREDVVNYASQVPDDFTFTIKAPNSLTLTHYYNKKGSTALTRNPNFLSPQLYHQFIDTLHPIKDKIGAVMLQFEYFNREKMNSGKEFFGLLEKFLSEVKPEAPLGIEIRNPNYLNQDFFNLLGRNNCIPVLLEGYFMKPVVECLAKYGDLIDKKLIVRLHGPDRSGIEEVTRGNWSEIVHPKERELNELIGVLKVFAAKGVDIYLNVNNHYEGSAPKTIAKIESILTK